jgi:iterative type I PKS product template protein
VALSAKAPISLRGNKQRLLDFIIAYPKMRLEDISYTLTARRSHHILRSAYCVSNVKELRQTLSAELISISEETSRGNPSQAPVIFVFPGQGFNFCGLAKVLYNTCSPFKDCLILLDDMAKSMDLPSFIHRLLDDTVADVSKISPVQAHLAIVAIEIALARLLKSWGLVPSAVVGHSLGEYAALCIAGVLTVADTLLLVGKRAQLVEELCTNGTHGMLVIQASAERVKSLLEDRVTGTFEVACVNDPETTVVNGRMKILESIQVILQETHRVRSSYVSVPYSFHSAQLDPILDEYRQVATSATFSMPTIPVASTLLGKIVDGEGIFSASYMVDQTRKPVQFQAAIQAIQAAGLATSKTMFVETGPGAMCLSMTQASLGASCKLLPCLKSADSTWKTLSKVVAEAYTGGIAINWSEYHKQSEANLTTVDLPSCHFNSKDYWIQYDGGIAALQEEVTSLKAQLAKRNASVPNVQEHREEEVVSPPINTCLHMVMAENISHQGGTAEIITDIQEVSLRQLISGHKVIGIALAPSSLYKDMALGAAKYLYERMPHGKPVQAMDLHDMSITSPMFLNESTAPQLITIRATMKPSSTTAQIAISSEGKPHCRCTVDLSPADWTRDWSRRSYLIKDRVRTLMSPSPDKHVHHLLKDMVYKIFFPITEYSSEYQSISEIYIDHSFREAAVRLDLRETPEGSSFTFDPCWLDNIAQTAGFVLNSDVANPDEMICMSTGVDTMRLSKAFSGGKKYLCHVRAESSDEIGNDLVCDVTVFDDEGVVALGEGLRFKRIRKALLQKMLGMSSTPKPTMERGPPPVTPSQPGKPVATVAKLPTPTPNSQVKFQTPVTYDKPKMATVQVTPVLPSRDVGGDIQIPPHPSTNGTFTPGDTFRTAPEPSKSVPKSRNTVLDNDTVKEKVSDNNDEYVFVKERGYSSSTSSAANFGSSGPSERDNQDTTPLGAGDEHEPEISVGSGLIDAILDAIAKETGLPRSDISEDTLFNDMGIDSLMSVAVLGVVKSTTGEELPANLFTNCESMVEVRQMLLEEEKEVNGV